MGLARNAAPPWAWTRAARCAGVAVIPAASKKRAVPALHDWDLSPEEAILLQRRLADSVKPKKFREEIRRLAGADAAYLPEYETVVAAAVVWNVDKGQIVDAAAAGAAVTFPYRTGLLSFREAPVVIEVLQKLTSPAQAILLDGQGLAHPRGLGLASHVGLWLNKPTLGCAKTRLVGQYDEPDRPRGSSSPLVYNGKEVGAVVRTRFNVAPVFVSPGHLMDVESAVNIVLTAGKGFRQPESLRQAHLMANRIRKNIRAEMCQKSISGEKAMRLINDMVQDFIKINAFGSYE